jgi:hypothetical protein
MKHAVDHRDHGISSMLPRRHDTHRVYTLVVCKAAKLNYTTYLLCLLIIDSTLVLSLSSTLIRREDGTTCQESAGTFQDKWIDFEFAFLLLPCVLV